jgi:hypothetical protein
MANDSGPSGLQLFGWAMLAGVSMIAVSLVNRFADPGPALRVVLSIAPVLPLAALAWVIMRAIQHLDELQRRIHLDVCRRDLWSAAARPHRLARPELGLFLSGPTRVMDDWLRHRITPIPMNQQLRALSLGSGGTHDS